MMTKISKKVAIGSDHGGFALKEELKRFLIDELQCDVEDLGCYDTSSCDYPDFGLAVAKRVASAQVDAGVLVCSTGIGISISANKVEGIRAALVHHVYEAEMTRRHNDANIICFGGHITGPAIAREALRTFLSTDFEGGRHQRRVDKMMAVQGGKTVS